MATAPIPEDLMDQEQLEREQRDPDQARIKFPTIRDRLPWETNEEYQRLIAYLFCPRPRSVRKAYRLYCTQNGATPKKDPPSTWFQLARGEFSAFQKAETQRNAIERAGQVHGRFPDWEGLAAVIEKEIAEGTGDLKKEDFPEGEIGQVMRELTLIEFAFLSLAIDKNGDPLPGRKTWIERAAAWWLKDGQLSKADAEKLIGHFVGGRKGISNNQPWNG
jgi:hypothetical protein